VKVRGQAILQAAWEGKLRGQAVPRGKDPSLELSSVPLELIPVLVDASKEICAAVDVQHDALAGFAGFLPFVVVGPHLNPLRLERAVGFAPLPPLSAPNLADAVGSQLLLQRRGSMNQLVLGDLDFFDLDPLGMGNPLRGESLQLLNRVVGGKGQE